MYVSESGRDRISCFGSDGKPGFSFGRRGAGEGELHDPRGLAVHTEQVWVADMCNHRISVFSLRGRHLRHLGRYGDGAGQFRHPVGVALAANLLLVSEYSGARVQVLSPLDGAFLQVVRAPFDGACVCALGADSRRLVVTDTGSRVHRFELARKGEAPPLEPPPSHLEAEHGTHAMALAPDPSADEARLTHSRSPSRSRSRSLTSSSPP